jgi:hypothetical protein
VVTALWFGPLHGRLVNDPYDPARIDQLADTNWLRTLAWWVRGALAVGLALWWTGESNRDDHAALR